MPKQADHKVTRNGKTYNRKGRTYKGRVPAQGNLIDRTFKVVREWQHGPDLDPKERAMIRKHELATIREQAKAAEAKKPKTRPANGEEKPRRTSANPRNKKAPELPKLWVRCPKSVGEVELRRDGAVRVCTGCNRAIKMGDRVMDTKHVMV